MKKKLETVQKVSFLFSLLISITYGCLMFLGPKKTETLSSFETITFWCVCACALGIATYGFFLVIIIRPLMFKEIKHAMNGYDYREVCCLFLNTGDKKIQVLVDMVKYKDYHFIAKLTDDHTIDLIVVDKDNKEICRKKIYNPVFFITNFKFI